MASVLQRLSNKSQLLALAVLACFLLAGCITTQNQSAAAPPEASTIAAKDLVLWQYRDALTYLRTGKFIEAKRLLDDAIASIAGNRANDKSARQARGYFHHESEKTYLGEPYERVMAYYYRGILYWMDGEPDNARACFRSAQLEDSDAEEHKYKSDYILLDYLDGFATAKLHGDGSDAYKRACELGRGLKLAPYDTQANVLLFIEYGNAPLKVVRGEYGEELHFRAVESEVHNAVVKVNRDEYPAPPYDDLFFQARTRGGRVMDRILANKAAFKTATDIAGDVGLVAGAIMAQGRDTQDAGIGVALAGALSKGVSALTKPDADIRCWDNLPQYLSFVSLKLPPGDHEVRVEFEDVRGNLLPPYTRRINLHIPAHARDSIIFISDKGSAL